MLKHGVTSPYPEKVEGAQDIGTNVAPCHANPVIASTQGVSAEVWAYVFVVFVFSTSTVFVELGVGCFELTCSACVLVCFSGDVGRFSRDYG